jgi:adenylate cyclase
MKRLRAIFDRFTLGALALTLGLGWLLWRTELVHDADYLPRTKPVPRKEKLHRWLGKNLWPEDGLPGIREPAPGNLGDGIRFKSYDWLFLLRERLAKRPPPDDALIVYLDEQSHAELGQPMNEPWDRRFHARLLDRLTAADVRAVVFDIIFLEQKRYADPEGDAALAEAARRASGRVVVAMSTRQDRSDVNKDRRVPDAIPPYRALRTAVNSADPQRLSSLTMGFPQLDPSYDEIVRLHPPSYPPFKHSLAWSLASLLQAPVTQATNEVEAARLERAERWLNYYGPGRTLHYVSFQDALDPKKLPDELFRNKVVFIGSATLTKFSGERKDAYISPYAALSRDEERFMAGVEIQATAAMNLLRGDWLNRLNLRWELFIIIAVGLVTGPGLMQFRGEMATALAASGILVVTGTAYWAFEQHRVWFGWLIPVTQIAAGWLYSVVFNSLRLFLRNRLLLQSISSYLSPKLALKFAGDKAQELMRPGATKHEVTVFFSDIAGFTSISERMDPDDLAHMMNQYFETAVGQCVFPTDGTVVKFIGDAIFAIWNAPDPQPDHAWRACDAALRFRQQAVQEIKGRQLITRIGLHTGEANVGNFGSQKRFDYTAFGENINLAARMEGLNKYLGTLTLMTGETFRLAGDRFLTRPLGRLVLKGFEKAVEVHELVGKPEQRAEFAELHAAFAAALAEFHAGRLDAAQAAFEAIKARWTEDGPTKFYLKAIAEFREHPSDKPWTGEVELKEK